MQHGNVHETRNIYYIRRTQTSPRNQDMNNKELLKLVVECNDALVPVIVRLGIVPWGRKRQAIRITSIALASKHFLGAKCSCSGSGST
jgi:hypothetical protein